MAIELLPVNAGDEPVELILRERLGFVARTRPAEVPLMQTTNAQPDGVLVPAQHLNAREGLVGEDECGTFVLGGFQLVLDILRQCVDPAPHIHGLYSQEDILRIQHNADGGRLQGV